MYDSSFYARKNTRRFILGFASYLFIAAIFLASLNFINKYFYFLYIGFGVLMLFLIGTRTFHINHMVFVLFGLSLCYLLFNPNSAYSITGFLKQFVYPLSYMCGLNCLKQFEKKETDPKICQAKREKGFIILCIVIATGLLVHIILNLIINSGGGDRNIVDFWTKDTSSATCNAAMFCFGIGIIPALFFSKSGVIGKTFATVNLAVFVAFALMLAGRTFFLLFAIVFGATLLFAAIVSKNRKKALRILWITALVCGAIALLYFLNAFGIKDAFENSNFYERFFGKWAMDITEDGRLERKRMYFENMFNWENMWGGGALREAANNKYAHELYLDILSDAGIIAYILVVVFVFSRTVRAVRFAASRKSKSLDLLSSIIFGLFLSMNIEFFIEPIVQGVPWLFPTFCLFCGMVDYLILKAPAPQTNERKETQK